MLVLALVGSTMAMVDAWTIAEMRHLPTAFVGAFYKITDFGKSGWLLVPVFGLLLVCVIAGSCARSKFTRLVFAAVTVRMRFLFIAIGAPGLFTTIIKIVIGRARPYVAQGNPFIFDPFVFRAQYASIPSGHSTTAFAAAVAIGALWPRARPVVWIYALVIGASRVIVAAHFPSDVVASAIIGVLGALLTRKYFASRGRAFSIRSDGSVYAFAGPSWHRLRGTVVTLISGLTSTANPSSDDTAVDGDPAQRNDDHAAAAS